MVHANKKDKAPKSELSPEKNEAPLNSSSNMEEEEDVEEEEYYKEEEEDDEGEPEEENVNDGRNTMVVVNCEELGTIKENAAKDKKKAKEPKNSEKSGEKSKSKGERRRTNGKQGSKRVETMGMVFMCSSKTKTDCFRYKILGLPENKKDQVLKIYSGMRLFLFDVDLRLMYGIFRADGPGGYNIEPDAFNSEFPSQVRFAVMEDCLPLAEEKFKDVLKENYLGRNTNGGLRSLLKSDQVKKLCKLFKESELCKLFKESGGDKESELCKLFMESRRGRARKSSIKARKAKPIETHQIQRDEIGRNQPDDRNTSRAQEKRKRRDGDEERRPCSRSHSAPVREKKCPHSRSRSPLVRERVRYTDYYHDHHRVLYDREPPVAPPTANIGSPVRVYAYERQPLDIPSYVRDYIPEHHTYRVVEERSRDLDPYPVYSREPPFYRNADYSQYRIASGSRVASYRDVETARDYRSSELSIPDYRSALPLSDYRSSLPLSDYRSALSLSDYRSAFPLSDYRSGTHYRY